MKNIERSSSKWLGGVCAGLARHFDINPIYLRLIALLAVFFTGGTAIFVYLICWIIIPGETKFVILKACDNGLSPEEIVVDHSSNSEKTTSLVKRLLIIGISGLIGCVVCATMGFFMVGSSAGNVFIPILGIIGLIIGGILGIIIAVSRDSFRR